MYENFQYVGGLLIAHTVIDVTDGSNVHVRLVADIYRGQTHNITQPWRFRQRARGGWNRGNTNISEIICIFFTCQTLDYVVPDLCVAVAPTANSFRVNI